MKLLVWAPALAGLAVPTLADLPVHCLRHQLVGDWDFFLGPPSPTRSTCGHLAPDHEKHQPALLIERGGTTKHITLQNPNLASTNSDSAGRWTMIYDEGFEVNVDGLSFFAFSRFEIKTSFSVSVNISHCGETQLGWYNTQDRMKFGCYYARKRTKLLNKTELLAYAPGPLSKSAEYDAPRDSTWHSAFAAELNLQQERWTAKAHEWFDGLSLRQLNRLAGIFRPFSQSEQRATDPYFGSGQGTPGLSLLQKDSVTTSSRRLRQRSSLAASDEDLPDAWDWRDVGGQDYLDPVIDQGDCGACYAVATMRMLSARHRIRQKDPTLEPWSISFPLHCSEYTQGCNGGYAFLTSRWSQDVGLVPHSCGKYVEAGECFLNCNPQNLTKRWRAGNHHYVGGYYGAATEQEMMRELVHDGPVVASFEPKTDIMYYTSGVYATLANHRTEWEQVDHAVLIVGYGKDNGHKYWIVQNSWGVEWGEGGFFRMTRGTDESGIESIVVAADVEEETRPEILENFVSAVAYRHREGA